MKLDLDRIVNNKVSASMVTVERCISLSNMNGVFFIYSSSNRVDNSMIHVGRC